MSHQQRTESVAPSLFLQSLLELSDDALSKSIPYVNDIVSKYPILDSELYTKSSSSVYSKWIERIISFLQSSTVELQWAGCCLTSSFVSEASHSVIKTHHNQLSKLLLSIAGSEESSVSLCKVSLNAIRDLYSRACIWPDSRRDIVINSLPKVVTCLMDIFDTEWGSELAVEILQDLAMLLKGSIRPFENQIRRALMHKLSQCVDQHIIDTTARALIGILSCCGEESVRSFIEKSIGLMETLVRDPLGVETNKKKGLSGMLTTKSNSKKGMDVESAAAEGEEAAADALFPSLPTDNSLQRTQVLQRQFAILCRFVCEYCSQTSASCILPIPALLQLIDDVMCIDVNAKSLSAFTGGHITHLELWSILSSLQSSSIQVLQSVLKVARRRLIVHSKQITGIIVRGFRKTAYSPSIKCFVAPQVRKQLVECYLVAVELFGASVTKKFTEPIVSQLIKDIMLPLQKQMEEERERENAKFTISDADFLSSNDKSGTSTSSGGGGGRKGKKRKQAEKAAKFIDNTSFLSAFHDMQSFASYEISQCAVHALETTLVCCGSHLSQKHRILIDRTLLGLLLFVESESGVDFCSKFPGSKASFLSCVLASLLSPLSYQSPLLPYCGQFFNRFLNDSDLQVRQICRRGISVMDIISHPRAALPTLLDHSTTIGVPSLNSILGFGDSDENLQATTATGGSKDDSSQEKKNQIFGSASSSEVSNHATSAPPALSRTATDAVLHSSASSSDPSSNVAPPPLSRMATDAAINVEEIPLSFPPLSRSSTDLVFTSTTDTKEPTTASRKKIKVVSAEMEDEGDVDASISTSQQPFAFKSVGETDFNVSRGNASGTPGLAEMVAQGASSSSMEVEQAADNKEEHGHEEDGDGDEDEEGEEGEEGEEDGEGVLEIVDAEPDGEESGSLWTF